MVDPDQAAASVKEAIQACALGVVSGLYGSVPEAIDRAGRGLLEYNSHESSIRKKVKELKPQQAALRENIDMLKEVFDDSTLPEGGAAKEVAKAAANEQPWIAHSGRSVADWAQLSEHERDKVRAATVPRRFRITLTHRWRGAVVL
jgi:hypothetical protein